MNENCDDYYTLVQRIEDTFAEIDSDFVTELAKNDDDYPVLHGKAATIKQEYSLIEKVLDGSGATSLTADEHGALARYVSLTRQREDVERQAIYVCMRTALPI